MAPSPVLWWSPAPPAAPEETDALDPTPPQPAPRVADIQRRELARVFERIVTVRLLLSPLIAVLALVVAVVDDAPWRRVILGAVALLMIGLSWVEQVRFRRHGLREWTLPLNLLAMALLQSIVIAVTGALDSPALPAMIPLAAVSVLLAPRRFRRWVPISQLAVVLGFAVVQLLGLAPWLYLDILGGPPLAGPHSVRLACVASVMVGILGSISLIGSGVRETFDGMIEEALSSRAALLEAHAEQSRLMRALSGEIAHELKNPLASIKGLSALVAREVSEGRAGERLAVLRGEVDRMQHILDELLTFTRPLVPLAVTPVSVAGLCREVAALHEGLAGERGVALRVQGDAGVSVACDPRKVHQVLINLLQNALTVSPAGSTITIAVQATADGAEIQVTDQGPGLDPELSARIFEPGVTGRSDGSGLGLTIARSLARQHGGELTLDSKPGGCVATLSLPAEAQPPEAP